MTADEVWGEPDAWRYVRGPVAVLKTERASDYTTPAMGFTEIPLYTRTAMEAYAAEKVAEALAAEPTKAMVDAGVRAISWSRNDRKQVTDIYRAMQAANQHHGGNDADT